jgi:hypothetical protein
MKNDNWYEKKLVMLYNAAIFVEKERLRTPSK